MIAIKCTTLFPFETFAMMMMMIHFLQHKYAKIAITTESPELDEAYHFV